MDTLPPMGELPEVEGTSTYGATLDPCPGMVLADRYELVEPIGRGASGWVWKAKHSIIGKHFAIKLLATRTGSFEPEAAIRMLREANTLSRVEHPNVIAVTDFGHARQSGTPFIVMELLEGKPLRAILDTQRLTWRQARVWGVQMLEGVEAAHEKGIVHRDLKPANLFVTNKESRLKVLDFGLAQTHRLGDIAADESSGRLDPAEVFGTPSTMSPEQIAGKDVDARSDLYSLGCVLYEMIAGRPPVHGQPAEILYQQVYVDPTPLRELAAPEVPDNVCEMVHRCLHKDPAARPASVTEVREVFDLRKVRRNAGPAASTMTTAPGASKRLWRLATAAAVATGALTALVAAARPAPKARIQSVDVVVPSLAAEPPAAPRLHADLPVFERATPKRAATRHEVESQPSRRVARRHRGRSGMPPSNPAASGSPTRVVQRAPKNAADPKVPELKNPFAK